MSVEEWLAGLGLQQYADSFRENHVDESLLKSLTLEDLRDIGVTRVGDRRRLLNAIALLNQKRPEKPSEETREPSGPEPDIDQDALDDAGRAVAPDDSDLGERRTVTVLFSDLVDSTELSTRHDPEELGEIMKRYRDVCAETIERFGGYVARFMGDGVLAYFGYPAATENAPESALRAGLAINEAVPALEISDLDPEMTLRTRVGVATGLVVVGDRVGKGAASESGISGETPNLAARFQQIAAPGQLICGQVTLRLAEGLFESEELPPQKIKGFEDLIKTYRILGERQVESRFVARNHGGARLIGRTQEKALLHDRWATACENEGQVVLITGDPGIGKSRLLQEFLGDIASERHFRIAFQCSPAFRDSALYPARRQLEMAAGFSAGDDAQTKREKLGAALRSIPETLRFQADLELFLDIQEPGAQDQPPPEQARAAALFALCERIMLASELRPVLCILEDAHWIDPSTLDLFTMLLERVQTAAVLVVVTFRPEFTSPWTQLPYATLLKLSRLSRTQSQHLIEALLEGRTLPGDSLAKVIEKTDGIPFFIEEVLRSLIESGDLEEAGGAARAAGSIPDSLNDTLLSRLDRDPDAKRVAQVASVIGREFSAGLLSDLTGMPPDLLESALASLVSSSIILRSHSPSGPSYSFKHGLLQEAAYATLLLRNRRRLHQRTAELLLSNNGDLARYQPEIIARHYDEAGMPEQAAEAWLAAGRYAVGRGAYREALQHLKDGLTAVSCLQDTPQRHRLELPLQMCVAETLRSARFTGGDDAKKACKRARRLCELLGDTANLMKVLRLEFSLNFNRPDIQGVKQVTREFTVLAERTNDPIAYLLGHQSRGCLNVFMGDFEAGDHELRCALEVAQSIKEEGVLRSLHFPTTALNYLTFANLLMGRVETASGFWEEALEVAAKDGKFARILGLSNSLIFQLLQRNDKGYRDHISEISASSAILGSNYWQQLLRLHQGLILAAEGDMDYAQGLVSNAVKVFKENAIEIEVPFYLGILAERLLNRGKADMAREILGDAVMRAEKTGERWFLAELYRLRGLAMLEEEPGSALFNLRQALSTAEKQHAALFRLRAAASLLEISEGSTAQRQARQALEEALEFFEGETARALPDVRMAEALLSKSSAA